MDLLCFCSVLCLLCLCARLFICALWSPAWKGFIKIISHYKKIGYKINVLQRTACLVVNPVTVGNFAFLFYCTLVGRTLDSMMVPT